MPIRDIAGFLLKHHVEAMCVLGVGGHSIGMVGEQDLLAWLEAHNHTAIAMESMF